MMGDTCVPPLGGKMKIKEALKNSDSDEKPVLL